jgi:beta-phosphoglucomutase family hydrolase
VTTQESTDEAGTPVHLPVDRMDATVFDMDGVVTDTADVHARAWTSVLDGFLHACSDRSGAAFRPFTHGDYLEYVDGKPRYDGAASFLSSRDLHLPTGHPSDSPGYGSVYALGNLKDQEFAAVLEHDGALLFPSTAALLRSLRARGIRLAVISSSRHLHDVLAAAGANGLFDASVDGLDAERLGLPGKPDPAIFLEAARRLGVAPDRTVVVEDALAGVEAGHRGGFLMVVGIDRSHRPERARQLRDHGADAVVGDLDAVDVPDTGGRQL